MRKAHTLICTCILFLSTLAHAAEPGAATKQQLAKIIIPKLEFQDAKFTEVVAYLHARAKDLSPDGEEAPNIIYLGPAAAAPQITISFDNMPMSEALRYIAKASGLELAYEEHAAVLSKAASASLSCEVTIAPAGEPHQYTVKFRLTEGKDALSAPTLTVLAGNEGVIQIGDDDTSIIRGTALVTENANGSATARTTLRLFDGNGSVRFFLAQDVTLAAPAPKAAPAP